jgi:hypothetical protein
MTSDLRVALSLWLNAYENARRVEPDARNDADQMRRFLRAVDDLAAASEELHKVADAAVEAEEQIEGRCEVASKTKVKKGKKGPKSDEDIVIVQDEYGVPKAKHFPGVVALLADWYEATDNLLDAPEPTQELYSKLESIEATMRQFVFNCKRLANPKVKLVASDAP